MPDRLYLHGSRLCRVVVWPNQRRKDLPEAWPLLRLRPYPPRNVLVEYVDGTRVVRPFRGLRRAEECATAGERSDGTAPKSGPASRVSDEPHLSGLPLPPERYEALTSAHSASTPSGNPRPAPDGGPHA